MSSQEEEYIYRTRRPAETSDPAVKRIVLGAGGLSVLVIAVALLWSGVRSIGFGPPPVIVPPPGPLRVAPADPGGLTVPEADVQIMSGDEAGVPSALAPAPAAPDVAQLNQAAGLAAPAPPTVSDPIMSGPAEVQLASMADEPGALQVWDALKAKLPELFAGKSAQIVPAVVGGKSVWRLLVPGFESHADAQAFCTAVVAKGEACTVAAF